MRKIIIPILFALWGCISEKTEMSGCDPIHQKYLEITAIKHDSFPVIMDTMNIDKYGPSPDRMTLSVYELNYIGKYVDTVVMGRPIGIYSSRMDRFYPKKGTDSKSLAKYISAPVAVKSYDKYFVLDYYFLGAVDSPYFHIIVDTSVMVGHIDSYNKYPSIFIKGYPVMIRNVTKAICDIGRADRLYLILEARSMEGEWFPVQKHIRLGCGTGVKLIVLPPGQIAVTSVPVFEGTFETELRLRLGNSYSHTFRGKINPEQFYKKEE